MHSLKQIVFTNLRQLASVMLVSILIMAIFMQLIMVQQQARENAAASFVQVGQVIRENKTALLEAEEGYRETCLKSAEAIAYMIQTNPDILGDVEEFRRIAVMIEVDEIHIFDTTGRIFTGSHPEYYDYTFESGEQIGFFKPLMTDKSLRLCQEITPNTAEGVLVQYSALWSDDEQFIVQVGMYPDTILELTEKNELSYIFTLLQGSAGVSLYAIDTTNGLVLGSTSGSDTGKSLEQLGVTMHQIEHCQRGSHININGVDSFCVAQNVDGTLIAYVIANDTLYGNIFPYTCTLALCLLLLVMVFVFMMTRMYRRYISDSIDGINEKLRIVSAGNLEERVDIQTTLEFDELSKHINRMVGSLLSYTNKMGAVLDRTNMPIGVYEYNPEMKMVRYTEHIPAIFDKSNQEVAELAADHHRWQSFMKSLKEEPIPQMENTYRLPGERERYIQLEEIVDELEVLGIVMDVTESTMNLRMAQTERDVDPLTGLYNRGGVERRLQALTESDQDLGYGVLIMIDSDNLKDINDRYGHAVGDLYLKRTADLISVFGVGEGLSAHLSGDEFLVLRYGYPTEESLMEELDTFRRVRDKARFLLPDGQSLPLRFSMGCAMLYGKLDYQEMLSQADQAMYEEKRNRKRHAR